MKISETIFPYQLELLKKDKRINAIISGTGAGKTYAGAIRLGLWALNPPVKNAIYYAVGPTHTHLKNFLWHDLINFLSRLGLIEKKDYTYNRSELVLTFKSSGARIMGKSAEVPASLQGGHVCGIVLDEAGLYHPEVFYVALQRVSLNNGQVVIVTTPYTWNWLKKEIYDPWIASGRNHPTIDVIQVDSIDNPFFSLESYEYARIHLPQWRFDMFFRGRFTKPAGRCYEVFETVKAISIDDTIAGANWRRWAGVDYGFSNPSAGCLFLENSDGDIFLIESFKQAKLSLDQLAKKLKKWECKIYMDPSAAGIINELQQKGIQVEAAKNDVVSGIMLVDDCLRSGKLKICIGKGYTELEEEISSYSWAVNSSGDPLDKVNKINDHLMDAMRYGIVSGSNNYQPVIMGIIDRRESRSNIDSWNAY
jgi:hypothetical protein